MNNTRALSLGTLLRYAGPAIPLSMLLMPPIIYIPPFYATEMKLSMPAIGFIFFIARLWDAFIDPLIGSLSDQTQSKWGRRKPWIAFGIVPLLMAMYLLFQPPAQVTQKYLFAVIFFFYLTWTVVQIPYLSWGAELSGDYRERNRVVGYRECGTMIGVLLATGVPAIVFYNHEPSLREILGVFALLTLILLPITTFMALRRTPDFPAGTYEKVSLSKAVRTLGNNKTFGHLLFAFLAIWLGVYIYNAGLLFVLEKRLGFSGSNFLKVVFLQFLICTAVTPLVVKLANRLGKHRVIAGSAVMTAVAFCVLAQARPHHTTDIVMFFAVLGVVIAPIWVLPTAVVADAADVGELNGGGRKEGLYMAIYNLIYKLAIAASVGIAMPLLSKLGFDPSQTLTEAGARAVNLVGLYLPALLLVFGAMVMLLYPVDARAHATIRERLEKQRSSLA
ncbi:MFS transporter [Paraburkholderia sp. D1E]|uniref:MFS transporter n=1 Tax=Paraburkholderia sp. D1E TaxID=3461398 RepID=UPI00404555C8